MEPPGQKYEYTGNLSLIYLRRITSRAQFTATVDASYQVQPDVTQVNAPTSNNRGAYIVANAKADLSYRLTPRFSSVTSVSYRTIYYVEEQENSNSYEETTFGTELRYLFSPRLTLLGELRYASVLHDENPELDTATYTLLVGGELTLSRRFSATLRVGEAVQTYETGDGEAGSAPYLEAVLRYRVSRATTVSWNARYGYEVAGTADSELIVFRTGLAISHVFTPRLQGAITLNYSRSSSTLESEVAVPLEPAEAAAAAPAATDTAADPATGMATAATPAPAPAVDTPSSSSQSPDSGSQSSTPNSTASTTRQRTEQLATETTQETVDASLSLQYVLSRRWSLSLNYSYTMVLAPLESGDYYRQRIFFGAQYQF